MNRTKLKNIDGGIVFVRDENINDDLDKEYYYLECYICDWDLFYASFDKRYHRFIHFLDVYDPEVVKRTIEFRNARSEADWYMISFTAKKSEFKIPDLVKTL